MNHNLIFENSKVLKFKYFKNLQLKNSKKKNLIPEKI